MMYMEDIVNDRTRDKLKHVQPARMRALLNKHARAGANPIEKTAKELNVHVNSVRRYCKKHAIKRKTVTQYVIDQSPHAA